MIPPGAPPFWQFLLLMAVSVYGFVAFSAAIASWSIDATRLPVWTRACVPARRSTTFTQHLLGSIVFLLLSLFAVVLVGWSLVMAIAAGDLPSGLVAAIASAAIGIWVWYVALRVPRRSHR